MDIDLLSDRVRQGKWGQKFDLDRNGKLDNEDRRLWVEDVFGTVFGDASLDRQVSFVDFASLSLSYGKQGGWEEGDFDGDGFVQFSDFLMLSANFGKPLTSVAAVPEPRGLALFCCGLLWMGCLRKRQRGPVYNR